MPETYCVDAALMSLELHERGIHAFTTGCAEAAE
jgi:hypothetical protein